VKSLTAAGGYSCHNQTTDRNEPYAYWRSEIDGIAMPVRLASVTTEWDDVPCGHITSGSDEGCEGCRFRR